MTQQLDLLVVAIPLLDLQYPPSSPAIIKSCAIAGGFTAKTEDLNLLYYEICKEKEKWYQTNWYFETIGPSKTYPGDILKSFFEDDDGLLRKWINQSIEIINKHNPKWLGISIFSYKSHKASLLLCHELKRVRPDIKIVLGGRGGSSFPLGPDHSVFKKKLKEYFGEYESAHMSDVLLNYGLADKVIHGDAERAIIELLEETQYQDSIKTSIEDIELEALPFVDYDDYRLDAYDYVNDPLVPITGSKGCVRKCRFCDIPVLWPKFAWRSGDHIAKEMIHLYERHGIKKFYLSDSLVNGALKSFKDFISTLAEYNKNHSHAQLKWIGQYITRRRSKSLNDEYYDMLKASGGEGLTIGVESGSDNVRDHMKKQFSTEDIDHELNEFDKRQIVCVLLFFSCYPAETWDDFIQTIEMFIRYQKYCASGTVYKLTLGIPYTHNPETPLWNEAAELGMSSAKGSDILWRLDGNESLTFYERIRRRLILQEVAVALTLPMSRNSAELNQLYYSLKNHKEKIDEYFSEYIVPVHLHEDKYNITHYDMLLMPPELQEKVYHHITKYPELGDKIKEKHVTIKDDIQFDNESYYNLRSILLESTKL